jgi:WD40 repeat protein
VLVDSVHGESVHIGAFLGDRLRGRQEMVEQRTHRAGRHVEGFPARDVPYSAFPLPRTGSTASLSPWIRGSALASLAGPERIAEREERDVSRSRDRVVDDLTYDAFLSYSHAADGQLAPALQTGLQRFGKPWYRSRALYVFRDQTSLAATPTLWPSIEQGLSASRWFVLLASPQAGASRWVARETAWWLAHRGPHSVLVVLTEGAPPWEAAPEEGHQQPVMPADMQVALTEPRWVDLRWARSATDVSLSNPAFRDRIADIAAPMHGLPKDELIGIEVEQHRRTRRLVRAVIATLVGLALLAATGAVVAVQQRDEARAQRDVATSRFLGAASEQWVGPRLDLALLLAAHAYHMQDTVEARSALLQAVSSRPALVTILQPVGDYSSTPQNRQPRGAARPDLGLAVLTERDGRFHVWDVDGHRELRDVDLGLPVAGLTLAPVGEAVVALTTFDGALSVVSLGSSRVGWEKRQEDYGAVAFSSDGTSLAAATSAGRVDLFDVADGTLTGSWAAPDARELVSLSFAADGDVIRILDDTAVERLAAGGTVSLVGAAALGDGQVSPPEHVSVAAVTADLQYLAYAYGGEILVQDLQTGSPATRLSGPPTDLVTDIAFSADGGTLVAGATTEFSVWRYVNDLWQSWNGGPQLGLGDLASEVLPAGDGDDLLIVGGTGSLSRWDIDGHDRIDGPLLSVPGLDAAALSGDGTVAAALSSGFTVLTAWRLPDSTPSMRVRLGSRAGNLTLDATGTVAAVSTDGGVELRDLDDPGAPPRAIPVPTPVTASMLSPDGELLAVGSDTGVVSMWRTADAARLWTDTSSDAPVFDLGMDDGSTLIAISREGTGEIEIRATESGESHSTLAHAAATSLSVAADLQFSADGSTLTGRVGSEVLTWDVAEGRRLRTFPIAGGPDVALDPSGGIAFVGSDEGLLAYDTATGRQLAEPMPMDAGLSFFEGDAITDLHVGDSGVVMVSEGEDLHLWTADPARWARLACRLVDRSISREEWARYVGHDVRLEPVCRKRAPR